MVNITKKKLEIDNELYDEDILDNNDIEIIKNNKNNDKSDDFER